MARKRTKTIRTCWKKLTAYLPDTVGVYHLRRISPVVDSAAVRREHRESPRVFAFVHGDTLHVASAILELPLAAILGILAHEAGRLGVAYEWGDPGEEEEADNHCWEGWGIPIIYCDYGPYRQVETIADKELVEDILGGYQPSL